MRSCHENLLTWLQRFQAPWKGRASKELWCVLQVSKNKCAPPYKLAEFDIMCALRPLPDVAPACQGARSRVYDFAAVSVSLPGLGIRKRGTGPPDLKPLCAQVWVRD